MPDFPLVSGNGSEGIKQPSVKTADDINDLFNTIDDEVVPEKKEVKTKEKEEVEEPEEHEDDDEIELKEPEDDIEKLDLKNEDEDISIDAPPRKKEILKKYPELFKDFPFMEKILYRDRQYNELFGSFDDAKEIAERAESFNEFESQLSSGNTEELLRGVKENDSKAFDTIVDNYLQTLHKVDKDAYYHVTGNLNKRLIMEMVSEANETGNEDLKQAALLVNQFVFGTAKFTAPQNRVNKDVNEETNKVEQERLNLTRERFESARDDLQTRVDNTLKATISEYIDQKGAMTAYVKKNAVADTIRILNASIASDSSFTKNLDKLWRAAFDAKFSRESLSRIQTAYLGKARQVLKPALLKARAEALKDLPARVKKEEKEEVEETSPSSARRSIATGRPSSPVKKNEMKKGESVADFFARD